MFMFTGLIEEVGLIKKIYKVGDNLKLAINANIVMDDLNTGDSIAIDGICLTVIPSSYKGGVFEVDVSAETISKTTIRWFKSGRKVNLERAAKLSSRLGGHLVTGHIDGIGEIEKFNRTAAGVYLNVKVPSDLIRYIVNKGSVAVDGISLTIAEINSDSIAIAIIPHTLEVTTLGEKSEGDKVNIECDIIGKYVERFVTNSPPQSKKINMEFLMANGFIP